MALVASHALAQGETSRGADSVAVSDVVEETDDMMMVKVDHPPLADKQLKREKVYYSIGEAMRNPDEVYKLSLMDQKLKQFPDIYRFRHLQVLNLSNNKIKEIPAEIERLPNLTAVILHNNKIRILPDEMKTLNNLRAMYLGKNRIATMPAWVGGLSKLRKLDLSYNLVTQYEIELIRFRLPRCEVTH
ncbi:MAG: leucine-rich repeat domain-containing protein [Bacteroidota bacterium]